VGVVVGLLVEGVDVPVVGEGRLLAREARIGGTAGRVVAALAIGRDEHVQRRGLSVQADVGEVGFHGLDIGTLVGLDRFGHQPADHGRACADPEGAVAAERLEISETAIGPAVTVRYWLAEDSQDLVQGLLDAEQLEIGFLEGVDRRAAFPVRRAEGAATLAVHDQVHREVDEAVFEVETGVVGAVQIVGIAALFRDQVVDPGGAKGLVGQEAIRHHRHLGGRFGAVLDPADCAGVGPDIAGLLAAARDVDALRHQRQLGPGVGGQVRVRRQPVNVAIDRNQIVDRSHGRIPLVYFVIPRAVKNIHERRSINPSSNEKTLT